MKLLGIDYGTKRVGIALSDEEAKFAFPAVVIATSAKLISEIQEIAEKNGVTEIVIGESRNYKGGANAILPAATELKKSLEVVGFVVHWEPEFMTSVQAERFQGKTELTDASAAALILQSYLDKK
ncbi:MAG: RuvX/YqgF family protein [Patescibacteria group bacterium]|mgnify:CR=1 FL=1